MDHIKAEEDWNLEPRFGQRGALELVCLRSAGRIENRSNEAHGGRKLGLASSQLSQLSQFFFQRHAGEETLDPFIHISMGNPGDRDQQRNCGSSHFSVSITCGHG